MKKSVELLDLTRQDAQLLLPVIMLGVFLLGIGFRWGVADRKRLESLFPPGSEALKSEAANIPQGTGWLLPTRGPIFAITERRDILHLYALHAIWVRHADEMRVFRTMRSMMRSKSRLDIGDRLHYGGLYYYPPVAFYVGLHLMGAVNLTSSRSHYVLHPEDLSRMILIGRIWIGFLFLLSAIVLYAVCKRLHGRMAGFAAALFWVSLPGSVTWSHEFKPHMATMFFVGFAYYLSILYLRESRTKHILWAFAHAALGASMYKLGGIAILFPVLVLFLSEGSCRHRLILFLKGSGVFLGIFALLNPFIVFYPWELIAEYKVSPAVLAHANLTTWQTLAGMLDFIPDKMIPSMTAWTLVLACIGIPRAVKLFRRESSVILIPAIAYLSYVAYLMAPSRGAPHHLPIARFGLFGYFTLSLFAGLAAAFLWEKSKRWGMALISLTLANNLLFSIPYLVNYHLDASPEATHLRAARWVHENIAKGEEIGGQIDNPLRFPPIQFINYKLFKMTDDFSPGTYPVPGRLPRHFITTVRPGWFHYRDRYRLLASFLPREEFFGLRLYRSLSYANEQCYIYKRMM